MTPRENPHLVEFHESLQGWTDERFITRDELGAAARFIMYLVNFAEEDGWTYSGHSYKVGVPMGLLVVKGTLEGVPHVVFTSGRTTIRCIRIFLRKLEEGLLEWMPDKYA